MTTRPIDRIEKEINPEILPLKLRTKGAVALIAITDFWELCGSRPCPLKNGVDSNVLMAHQITHRLRYVTLGTRHTYLTLR